jgi:hypothetical protein
VIPHGGVREGTRRTDSIEAARRDWSNGNGAGARKEEFRVGSIEVDDLLNARRKNPKDGKYASQGGRRMRHLLQCRRYGLGFQDERPARLFDTLFSKRLQVLERDRTEAGRVLDLSLMDDAKVKKWLHDLNNRVGMILASAELMQLEQLSPKAQERRRLIEDKSLELRQIIRDFGDYLFSES